VDAASFEPAAFFEPAGTGAFVATPATAGPWSPDAQHGGPPSALAAWVIEQHEPAGHQRLARVAIDILRPVPLGKLTTRVRTVRAGRRIALLESVLEADGQEVLHARGWRIERPRGPVPVVPDQEAPAQQPGPPTPSVTAPRIPRLPRARTAGYLSHIDWQFLDHGGLAEPGPGRAWARPRIPLIAGQQATPMCQALLVADSGSGISAVLDGAGFIFINVDLTVALTRDPAGDWLLLEAETRTGSDGTGLARSVLSDISGVCGTGLQTLLVAPAGRQV
jgi:hypothetical protein